MRHQLAQVYDETCRKAWALKAARGKLCFTSCDHLHATLSLQGDSDFDLKAASLKLDNELLDEAKALYMVEFPAKEHVVLSDPYGGSLAACSPISVPRSHLSAPEKHVFQKKGKGKGKGKSAGHHGARDADNSSHNAWFRSGNKDWHSSSWSNKRQKQW
jgi:hypothetical protein